MQENTNRIIAVNSIVLYIRMVVTTICALLTTRFALQALGVIDFGLFNVLGGIISFIGIFNTIMLSTSNRYIAVAIGRGNMCEVNKQFNVNLVVHIAIALFAMLVALPVGEWYIPRYVNYDGPLSNAMMVYYISIIGSIISFIGVPYNGVIMAKERFVVFCAADIFLYFIKMIVAWLLINHFEKKLLIYTITMALLTSATTLIYIVYCYRYHHDIVRLRRVRERGMYKNVFGFSSWVSIGAVSQVARDQGAALIVNLFFSTIMNAAMGIASSINVFVSMFANNVVQPMQPQISKNYAAGNYQRCDELLIMSTKYCYLLVLLMGSVFFIAPDWLLGLWLDEVPPYASVFLVLFIINNLINSLNSGVGNIIWANGNIRLYQLCVTSLNILSLLLGWIVLRLGAPAYYLTVTYIVVSVIRFFIIQGVLKKTLNYNNKILWKNSYLPSIIITVFFILSLLLFPMTWHPAMKLLLSLSFLIILEWIIGLNKNERQYIKSFLKGIVKK